MSERIEHSALVSELQNLSWGDVKCMAIHLNCMDLAVLDKIEEDHPTDSNQRVMYAMKEWLQRDTVASWKNIVGGLREINKNALATEIERKYCAEMTTPRPSEPMPFPQSGAKQNQGASIHRKVASVVFSEETAASLRKTKKSSLHHKGELPL